MEIKAGDKVRIKSWEAMEAEFGLDGDGDVALEPYFTEAMKPMCGETFTVVTADDDEEEEPSCTMAPWMVEEVIA